MYECDNTHVNETRFFGCGRFAFLRLCGVMGWGPKNSNNTVFEGPQILTCCGPFLDLSPSVTQPAGSSIEANEATQLATVLSPSRSFSKPNER